MLLSSILGLILLGILVLIIEIFIVPGTTVVGLAGIALILTGIYFTYAELGTTYGHYVTTVTILLCAALIFAGFRVKVWRRFMIKSTIEGKANLIDTTKVKVGDKGISVSKLQPFGTILINDNRFEATSMGEFIETNKQVEVIKVYTNKIIIKEFIT